MILRGPDLPATIPWRPTTVNEHMPSDDVVERIAALSTFAAVPRAELEWLRARGQERRHRAGETLVAFGSAIGDMWILLAGRIAVYMQKGHASRKVFETGPGYVLGALPYSRLGAAPASLIIEDDTILFELNRAHFFDLVRECEELTAALVHHMVDRARDFRTLQLHDERMQSLGRLAAGLAHELNNPAAGAASHARSLAALLDEAQAASRALARARLTDAQLEAIETLERSCATAASPRSPIQVADREEEFYEWLLRHSIDPRLASTLAASEVSPAALERLANLLLPGMLATVICYMASTSAARIAAAQVVTATGRISDLVSSVKGFTFMDREGVPEEIDIARGLADTVAMLESKSRSKSVRVQVETADHLPRIYGYGSEINQIWVKLIDNAIDAVTAGGNVNVTASRRGDEIVVRVIDDGPGISDEIRARVFDPFFTTKAVGFGTGLGLDIARRFAHLHNGDVDFTSQPGRTIFRVRLPVSGAQVAARRQVQSAGPS
jgi:signal transduction histidine kinase